MKEQKKSQTVKVVLGKQYLECKLESVEILKYSKELSECISQNAREEDSLNSFKAQAKAKIEELQGRINLLSEKIKSEKEYRTVNTETRYDFETGKKTRVRMDTFAIVDTSDITDQERQQEMEFAAA